jgi:hypothetical protein
MTAEAFELFNDPRLALVVTHAVHRPWPEITLGLTIGESTVGIEFRTDRNLPDEGFLVRLTALTGGEEGREHHQGEDDEKE